MKASPTNLGLFIQHRILEGRALLDDMAQELKMNPDSLSNLIHGRRRMRNHLLKKLAETQVMRVLGVTYTRLRAGRATDEYTHEELALAANLTAPVAPCRPMTVVMADERIVEI